MDDPSTKFYLDIIASIVIPLLVATIGLAAVFLKTEGAPRLRKAIKGFLYFGFLLIIFGGVAAVLSGQKTGAYNPPDPLMPVSKGDRNWYVNYYLENTSRALSLDQFGIVELKRTYFATGRTLYAIEQYKGFVDGFQEGKEYEFPMSMQTEVHPEHLDSETVYINADTNEVIKARGREIESLDVTKGHFVKSYIPIRQGNFNILRVIKLRGGIRCPGVLDWISLPLHRFRGRHKSSILEIVFDSSLEDYGPYSLEVDEERRKAHFAKLTELEVIALRDKELAHLADNALAAVSSFETASSLLEDIVDVNWQEGYRIDLPSDFTKVLGFHFIRKDV